MPSINERLSPQELEKREGILQKMKNNKRQLVKKYGKDAEQVMYGRATNLAKNKTEESMNKLRETIMKCLSKPLQEQDIEVGATSHSGEEELSHAANLLGDLETALQTHDWAYQMSDDHRYWERGEKQSKNINNLMKQLKSIGYGDDAQSLYDQFKPNQSMWGEGKLTEVINKVYNKRFK
jgi:hypothetical protein